MYGDVRLRRYFTEHAEARLDGTAAGLWEQVERFSAYAPAEDDRTLLLIRVL